MVVGHAGQIDHVLAIAAPGYADVGFARLARTIDDAAENRERKRRFNVAQRVFEFLDGADDVEALPCATWTTYYPDAAGAQAQ